MKQLVILAVNAAFLLILTGCQNSDRAVEVTIDGDGRFPDFLVGKWRADKNFWEITFEGDGTISSVTHELGRVEIKAGQTATIAMKRGGTGLFEPGKWTAHYAPADRELKVMICLEYFRVEILNDVMEGKSTDYFVGKVSEDGRLWQTAWRGFPDYTAHTDKYPDFRLAADPNYGRSDTLTFIKVER